MVVFGGQMQHASAWKDLAAVWNLQGCDVHVAALPGTPRSYIKILTQLHVYEKIDINYCIYPSFLLL